MKKDNKMTKKDQIEIFGDYLFGRKSVYIDIINKIVCISVSKCFGTDWASRDFTFTEIETDPEKVKRQAKFI